MCVQSALRGVFERSLVLFQAPAFRATVPSETKPPKSQVVCPQNGTAVLKINFEHAAATWSTALLRRTYLVQYVRVFCFVVRRSSHICYWFFGVSSNYFDASHVQHRTSIRVRVHFIRSTQVLPSELQPIAALASCFLLRKNVDANVPGGAPFTFYLGG